MRFLVATLIVLGLAGGGYYFWKKRPVDDAAAQLANRQRETVVERRSISFAVNVAGEISPAEQVSVRPEINGRIENLPVDVGDKVKKGQLLFKLDDQELQNQKAGSVTEVDRAKLQLDQATRNFERNEMLFKDKLISQELYETSRTELDLARNSVERAKRELSVLEERLTKTQILAPFDCTVLTRPISMGQAVAGSGGMSGGTEVLTIADLNQMVINAHVNQADVVRLHIGQQVTIQVEAVAGLQCHGVVERIAPQATIKNNVKGFAARILIKDPDPRIQPGMTANITIPVTSADNVLAVKLAAVFTEINPQSGQAERYVYARNGDTFERRPVEIGVSDYFYAELLSGVEEGEVLAIEQPAADQITQLSGATKQESPAVGQGTAGRKPRSGT